MAIAGFEVLYHAPRKCTKGQLVAVRLHRPRAEAVRVLVLLGFDEDIQRHPEV